MSKGHTHTTAADRQRAIGELKLALLGKPVGGGPFDDVGDFTFPATAVDEEDTPLVTRVKMAIARDSRYATARGPYLTIFGMNQSMYSIYTGGRLLIDSGSED